MEILKIHETKGRFETVSIAKNHLEADNPSNWHEITETYFRGGDKITEYEFYHGLGLGSGLVFVNADSDFGFDIPVYSRNAMFNSIGFYSKYLPVELHPQISNPCMDEIGYTLYYPNGAEEERLPVDGAMETNLLMINGTFLPKTKIMKRDGTILVPLRLVSDYLGKTIAWDEKNKAVAISGQNDELNLFIANDGGVLDKSGKNAGILYDNRIYVPAKLIEKLNASIDIFTRETASYGAGTFNVLAIETNYSDVVFISVDEAKQKILSAADECTTYLKSIGNKEMPGGYSIIPPQLSDGIPNGEIEYKRNIGRYYVFAFKEYKNSQILINRYTGEIFSGSGFAGIGTGLPDIRRYYLYSLL